MFKKNYKYVTVVKCPEKSGRGRLVSAGYTKQALQLLEINISLFHVSSPSFVVFAHTLYYNCNCTHIALVLLFFIETLGGLRWSFSSTCMCTEYCTR